jgi:hypothetical protein
MTRTVSVMIRGKVYDLGLREGDTVRVAQRGEWCAVPWHHVERWRPRASYHRYGTAPWQENAA